MIKFIKIKNKLKKGDLISITYLSLHLKNIRKKLFTGFCTKIKNKELNTTLTLKLRKKKNNSNKKIYYKFTINNTNSKKYKKGRIGFEPTIKKYL